jgi:hypothetical protein
MRKHAVCEKVKGLPRARGQGELDAVRDRISAVSRSPVGQGVRVGRMLEIPHPTHPR